MHGMQAGVAVQSFHQQKHRTLGTNGACKSHHSLAMTPGLESVDLACMCGGASVWKECDLMLLAHSMLQQCL